MEDLELEKIDIEIPPYFLCPISLQIMKDPVTTITGITYDRESIDQWLRTSTAADEATCPFTKQPLPRDSDLTPNHMLRQLIQSWCTTNARYGIVRIPTPKSPLTKSHVVKLIRNLMNVDHDLYKKTAILKKMDELANENEKNRKVMMEAGVVKVMVKLIIKCFQEKNKFDSCLEQVLRILLLVWCPSLDENNEIIKDNHDLIQSLTWVLSNQENVIKTYAMRILKTTIEVSSSWLKEQLKDDFFIQMVDILHQYPSQQAVKSCLNILIQVCQWSRNRLKIVEAGAVFVVIELELGNKDKKVSELNLCLLAHLCACADGRAQFLKHACGIAMVSKRILRVSPTADDQAVHILALISRYSATNDVVMEMSNVGAVSKLFMVIQADCEPFLKKKASEVFRLHSNVWSTSPCIQIYLLTWNTRFK